MDKKEIRQKLKISLDMAYVRINFIIYGFFLLWGALLGLARFRHDPSAIPTAISIFAVCGLIVLIPALRILFRIYRDVPAYRLYKATLSQPHGGFPRGYMYFTIVLEDPDGAKFIVNTNTVFQSYGTSFGPSMEDYVNQTVTVAYNEDTAAVVVIG